MPKKSGNSPQPRILVTGVAGFIGYHVTEKLLALGHEVVGIDNLNNYYDPHLKMARLKRLEGLKGFTFCKVDISDSVDLEKIFKTSGATRVIHLAAQAGVRYCIENPRAYVDANLVGFVNILENCRHHKIDHLVYASTSSVFGLSTKMPFSEHDDADHPVSLYGATKRANELMAHSYGVMFGLPTTGLRFFTVYGPWGRPDMALFKFTKAILAGEPIDIYNHGNHKRDFTYIDDIAEGVVRVAVGEIPQSNSKWDSLKADPATSSAPFRIYNIGNSKSEPLMKYIETLEKCIGKTAEKKFLPMQQGDVPETHANVSDLAKEFAYQPSTSIEVGVKKFVEWYREYYRSM